MSDIKSMIKSRRDQRYYGSSFEKRSNFTDETRLNVLDHRLDEGPDYAYETAPGDRNLAQDDYERSLDRSVDDPNPGRKEQPKLNEIRGKAYDYAAGLEAESPTVEYKDFYANRQALLDKGYSEDDLRKFEEIYDRLMYTKNKTRADALDNADRIDRELHPDWARYEWDF